MNQESPESSEEAIELQIDRLNLAVQRLMQGIETPLHTQRNPSQLSYAFHERLDSESEKSEDILYGEFETRFEEVLVHLDRSQMMNEDFWSEAFRRENSPRGEGDEAYILKLERENMQLRSKALDPKGEFSLSLRKSSMEAEKRHFEEVLKELDGLNEACRLRHIKSVKFRESLRAREKVIEQKERELKNSWQNFEKAKAEFYSKKGIWEDTAHSCANLIDAGAREPGFSAASAEAPPPGAPETPSTREKTIKGLQSEISELEARMKAESGPEERSKVAMKMEQLKNKLAALRGQKALFESSRSSRLISSMMKTMEKEVNYEEQKRKQQLEKYTKKGGGKGAEPANHQSCNAHEMDSAAHIRKNRLLFTEKSTDKISL